MALTARGRPTAATWSLHGSMARMPAVAQASTMPTRSACRLSVAVLIESQWWSCEKSRMATFASRLDAAQRQHAPHAGYRALGFGQQAGLVREPEQLGQMQGRARALLAADHGEMVLVAV